MILLQRALLSVTACCLLAINPAFSQPLLDDQFDDTDPAVNSTGFGNGWNVTTGSGAATEGSGLLSLSLGSNGRNGILSQDLFTANSATPLIANFTFTEMARSETNASGNGRYVSGLVDNNEEDVGDDGFDDIATPNHFNPDNNDHKGGLYIAFKERDDIVGRTLDGDEGSLYYVLKDGPSTLLATWVWDRSLFAFDEDAVGVARSDRIMSELLVPLQAELTSDATGYGLRFFSTSDTAVVPDDISGTWADAGVTDLSSLSSVRAVAHGSHADLTTVDIDRVYIDDEPQRDADDSGQNFTFGARTADSNWGDTTAWQAGGVNTANIPGVVTSTRSADSVAVNSGIVRVSAADQGAWALQIDNGATTEVATGFALEIIENVSDSATNIDAGGNLILGGTLITPTIASAGTVTFDGGTLRLDHGTIDAITATGDGVISNAREVTVGQVTLGSGNTLIKQRAGTLILDQSGGANSIAAGSVIASQFGTVAGVNDAANNAFGSAIIDISGGSYTLSASDANSTAFDNAVSVSTSGTIRAARITGALAGETVTLGGTNGISLSTGSTVALDTADGYSLNVAGDISGAGTVAVADGASVSLNGTVSSAIVEFRGDTSGVSIGGTLVPTAAYNFVPTEANPNMVFGFDLTGSADVVVDGGVDPGVDGTVALTGSLSYTGVTRIVRGALQVGGGSPSADFDSDGDVDGSDFLRWQRDFPALGATDLSNWQSEYGSGGAAGSVSATSNLQFEGSLIDAGTEFDVAVVQLGGGSSFARDIGTGAGEVNWVGSGGFAGDGAGTSTVTLEGGSGLSWSSATAGFNGQTLQFGSLFATGHVNLTNDINLENASRFVEVVDNDESIADIAEISGAISSTAGGDDVLVVRGPLAFVSGHLVLSGANSYSALEIGGNTVEATDGVGLPATANLRLNNAIAPDVIAVYGTNGVFDRNIGTGPGEVQWIDDGVNPGGGGFAAIGGDLTVSLEGGATLDYSDPGLGPNGKTIDLGSNVATGVTTFTNDAIANGTNQAHFKIYNNPLVDTDHVVISGQYTGFNDLRLEGVGLVEFSGTGTFADDLVAVTVGYTPFQLHLNLTGDVTIADNFGGFDTDTFINGTLSLDNILNSRDGNTTGGSGTLFLTDNDGDGAGSQVARLLSGTTINAGADFDSVGTLTIDMTAPGTDSSAGSVEFRDGSILEVEFEDAGGVQNDLVHFLSNNEFGLFQLGLAVDEEWTLTLDALNDLTGLITGTDQFDILTWNTEVDFAINGATINLAGGETGAIDNVVIGSDEFDITGASVRYEVAGDLSGRVFVTGLGFPSAVAAAGIAVPEPSSCVVAALAAVASLCFRQRGTQ